MGKKFRVRLGSNKGKNVIKKGESSSSNPKSNKHRLAAKTASLLRRLPALSVDDLGEGGASCSDELTKHLSLNSMSLDAKNNSGTKSEKGSIVSSGGVMRLRNRTVSMQSEEDDEALTRFSRNSAKSDYTQFTNCTNPTFDPVHREWKSGSKLHADVVAVLAAVSEIIHQNNGNETDPEYFGALLTCLENTPNDEIKKIAATAYLFHLNVKKVPKTIVIRYFSHAAKIISEKMDALDTLDDSQTAIKFLLSSLGNILLAQPSSIWEYTVNRNILVTILKFSNNNQPWVRNMSRRVLRNLLTDPVRCADNGVHPIAKFVGEVILQGIQSPSDTKAQKTSIARLLCLLEGILHKMPKSIFLQLAENILHLGTINDKMMKCAAFQCLQKALLQQPNDSCLTTETNIQLIVALRTLQFPSDISVCAYWLKALVEAHVCLAAREELKSVDMLDETLQIFTKLFRRRSKELCEAVYESSSRLIQCCIQQNSNAAVLFLRYLHQSLDVKVEEPWRWVLKTMERVFEEAQSLVVGEEFATILKSSAEFRDRDEACFCCTEIEQLFGSAIRHVGVVKVLETVSLNITDGGQHLAIDFKRTWLLPIINKSICNASLQFFSQYFLPLAIKIHDCLPGLPELQAKLYSVVESQIWSLLPKMLSTNPVDFYESFPPLCPIIGAALNERPDLRLTMLSSVRAALIHSSSSVPASPSEMANEKVMERFAKNFLPILFSIYIDSGMAPPTNGASGAMVKRTTTACLNICSNPSVKLATLETVRLYASMTPKDLLATYINKAIEKVRDAENSLQKKALIMDLLIALSRFADSSCLLLTIDAIKDWFISREIHMQKKAYRLLGEVYQRIGDKGLYDFFAVNFDFVKHLIDVGIKELVNSMEQLDHLQVFCNLISNELVTYLDKKNSKHTKVQATRCLQDMCSRLIHIASEKEDTPNVIDPVLETFLSDIPENVADSEKLLARLRSNLIGLTTVCQRHVNDISASSLSRVVAYATFSVSVKNFEVRPLAIRLIRALCVKMPRYCLEQYKELLLSSTFTLQPTKTSTVRVRKANVLLFGVFLDKFGIETVMRYASRNPVWVKQLKNMEKARRRRLAAKAAVGGRHAAPESGVDDDKNKRRSSRDEEMDSDDDSDDEESNESGSDDSDAITIK